MSTYSELRETITKMESDINDLKVQSKKPYLTEYESGFKDGAIESMEASLKLLKVISNKLSWEETPPTPRGDGEWGDVPPIRTGMGG